MWGPTYLGEQEVARDPEEERETGKEETDLASPADLLGRDEEGDGVALDSPSMPLWQGRDGLTKRILENDCKMVATAAVFARSRGEETSTTAVHPEPVR